MTMQEVKIRRKELMEKIALRRLARRRKIDEGATGTAAEQKASLMNDEEREAWFATGCP